MPTAAHGRRHSRVDPRWTIVLGLVLTLVVAGGAEASQSWEGHGRIISVDAGRSAVTIEHSGIPGLLAASRSELPVQSGGMLEGLGPGDRVRFTLGAIDDSHGLLTVVSLVPESAVSAGGLDRRLVGVLIALAILTIATAMILAVLLRRELRTLQRQVIALDHEAGLLRNLVADTQDESRQIARALEDAAAVLRI